MIKKFIEIIFVLAILATVFCSSVLATEEPTPDLDYTKDSIVVTLADAIKAGVVHGEEPSRRFKLVIHQKAVPIMLKYRSIVIGENLNLFLTEEVVAMLNGDGKTTEIQIFGGGDGKTLIIIVSNNDGSREFLIIFKGEHWDDVSIPPPEIELIP